MHSEWVISSAWLDDKLQQWKMLCIKCCGTISKKLHNKLYLTKSLLRMNFCQRFPIGLIWIYQFVFSFQLYFYKYMILLVHVSFDALFDMLFLVLWLILTYAYTFTSMRVAISSRFKSPCFSFLTISPFMHIWTRYFVFTLIQFMHYRLRGKLNNGGISADVKWYK